MRALANRILKTNTYHDEIRARLGVGKEIISDNDIDAPSVVPVGEAKVIARVPGYVDLTDDNAVFLYSATICTIAAILAPSMYVRIKKATKDFDFTVENFETDWDKVAAEAQAEAEELLSYIPEASPACNVPIFGLAGPTRAKANRRWR